jgi:hypothetical protein
MLRLNRSQAKFFFLGQAPASTPAMLVPPLITVWLEVQILPGPPRGLILAGTV